MTAKEQQIEVQVYNSLGRAKQPFVTQEPGKVKMYVCGPTVYDYIHIGNARPVIFFDVVRRFFEQIGYEVNFIQNFTDVDDKLIRKADELGSTVPEVAERFIAAFYADTDALGVRRASLNPRVMEHIEEIVAFIQGLFDKGYAYESGGDVYYRTTKFADYGKLSQQKLDELQYGIRVEVDERKENPQDFVLWKGAKPGEISWESPWGAGRPGWHIECSTMARTHLGDTLDIHGGGQDLQFPHHECEIAQSEALTGKPLANYWLHNGYISIDNEKMSKSLGNGIFVHDLIQQVKPLAIRYFMLSTHYRSPLNFSDDTIAQAISSVDRIANSAGNLRHRLAIVRAEASEAGAGEVSQQLAERLSGIRQQFINKLADDFNTPDAITAIFDLVSEINLQLQQTAVQEADLQAMLDLLMEFDQVLGLVPAANDENDLLDEEIDQLIQERMEARQAKNWTRSDEIRDLLDERGIVLEDTPLGVRWRRK